MGINNLITGSNNIAVNNVAPIRSMVRSDELMNNAPKHTRNLQEIKDDVSRNQSEMAMLSVPDKAIITAIDHINHVVAGADVELRHTVHKETNSVIITLIDKNTNDIILEIPPEKVLDAFVKRLEINGLLVNERR